jgi:pimeloyl-ACP methyl ester carboxylesterase
MPAEAGIPGFRVRQHAKRAPQALPNTEAGDPRLRGGDGGCCAILLADHSQSTMTTTALQDLPLPPGVRSRIVPNNNGCDMHVLEAGYDTPGRPCVLLLHGFPELAFSWRKQLPVLAAAGFHVIAPDQRGYGRSSGTDVRYEDPLVPFTPVHRVADLLGLVRALGHESVACVVGHDYGSHVAGWCALLRPDVFRSVVFMSATFTGAPALPLGSGEAGPPPMLKAMQDLASLPRPRQHYWEYYATPHADREMRECPEGLHAFLRAYFHMKSGAWPENAPFVLKDWSAGELAKLPTYYVMDAGKTMPESVAGAAVDEHALAAWLPDEDLRVYTAEFGRTGFQGGLQSYRVTLDPQSSGTTRAFAGRTIDVPSAYISGARDWGNHQVPGGLARMVESLCTRMQPPEFIAGAGHWVQQEAADEVNRRLLRFLASLAD